MQNIYGVAGVTLLKNIKRLSTLKEKSLGLATSIRQRKLQPPIYAQQS